MTTKPPSSLGLFGSPPANADIFYQRARWLKIQAWLFLFAIIGLLFVARSFYVNAGSIATLDFNGDSDKRIDEAVQKADKFRKEAALDQQKLSALHDQAMQSLGVIVGAWHKPTQNPDDPPRTRPIKSLVVNLAEAEPTKEGWVSKIQQNIDTMNDVFQYNIQFPADNWGVGIGGTKQDLQNFVDFLRTSDLKIDSDQIRSLSAAQSKAARETNHFTTVSQEIASMSATAEATENHSDNNVVQPSSGSIITIVQINILRFGSLAIILFLVTLLISLYKFNIRLAYYYTARGDVFKILGESAEAASFSNMAAALTPPVDFGKTPQTPIEQVLAIARAVKADPDA